MEIEMSSAILNLLKESPAAYYWAGFLMADGYINHAHPRISLRLQKRDWDHLNQFADFVGSKCAEFKLCYSVDIRDINHITEFINKFDFRPDKTHNPPDISIFRKMNDHQFLSFLVGFIDGDGHLGINNFGCPYIQVGCHSAWSEVLSYFKTRLYKTSDSKMRKTHRKYVDRKTYMVRIDIGSKNALKFLQNSVTEMKLPVLRRKWDQFLGGVL